MEELTPEEQLAIAAETTIMIGVHGNGLTHLLWMPLTPLTTVMEIFYPGGFAKDYEWTARVLGFTHYAIHNDTAFTHPTEPKVNYPPGFQGTKIPVHGPSVAKIIEDRIDGRLLPQPGCGMESGEFVPRNQLPGIREELYNAKAKVNNQIDQLIARISSRMNQEFKPVNQDPLRYPVSEQHHTTLFDLLLVCRSWHDIAIRYPRLWIDLDSRMPPRVAQIALERSKPHGINMTWRIEHSWNVSIELKQVFMENRDRSVSMDIKTKAIVGLGLRQLIEGPTPQLESLCVAVDSDNRSSRAEQEVLDGFELSDGPPLKYLNLAGVQAAWNSPRLSGLLSLIITGRGVPNSPRQLFDGLAGLQQLEVLCFQKITSLNVKSYRPAECPPVTLPHLKRLCLWDTRAEWTAMISSNLYTPACFDADISDESPGREYDPELVELCDTLLWNPNNPQAAVLLGFAGLEPRCEQLTIQITHYDLFIGIPFDEFKRCDHTKVPYHTLDTGAGRTRLELSRRNPTELLNKIAAVVSQLPSFPPIALEVYNLYNESSISLPDLLPWSEHLTSVYVMGASSSRAFLQQLLQRRSPATSTREELVCKNLSAIKLEYENDDEEDPMMDSDALLALAGGCWFEGDSETALQPGRFDVHCPKKKFSRMWSLEGEIQQIVPVFKLFDI
ncbi:hypothetical protein FRB90_001698 [Tulasnella sp. 427]|nr:hypothetical protein FRB90_001698 [Tulasnella sp. 427]